MKEESKKIFSDELREALKDFDNVDVRDCLQDRNFWKTLGKYGGISDEQIENIFKENDEKARKGEAGPPISSLWE